MLLSSTPARILICRKNMGGRNRATGPIRIATCRQALNSSVPSVNSSGNSRSLAWKSGRNTDWSRRWTEGHQGSHRKLLNALHAIAADTRFPVDRHDRCCKRLRPNQGSGGESPRLGGCSSALRLQAHPDSRPGSGDAKIRSAARANTRRENVAMFWPVGVTKVDLPP